MIHPSAGDSSQRAVLPPISSDGAFISLRFEQCVVKSLCHKPRNCKLYCMSQIIANCTCLKLLQIVFVSNYCKLYLSQITNCICLKLQIVFVSNCKMYFSLHPCTPVTVCYVK